MNTLDIQRSKFDVANLHLTIASKTYNYLAPIQTTFTVKILSWKEKQVFCEHKCFFHKIFTNFMGRWFLTINKPISLKNIFWPQMTFLERIFGSKKIDNWIARWIWSIFGRLFLHFSFQKTLHFLKHFCNNKMVYIHMFFSMLLVHLFYYIKLDLSLLKF
jgi:hypothetical protein